MEQSGYHTVGYNVIRTDYHFFVHRTPHVLPSSRDKDVVASPNRWCYTTRTPLASFQAWMRMRLLLERCWGHRSYTLYLYRYIDWYRMTKKDCTAIYVCLEALNQRRRDNAHPAPNLCTSSCNESSGRSVGCAANYQLHLRNKINKCICIKYASSRY